MTGMLWGLSGGVGLMAWLLVKILGLQRREVRGPQPMQAAHNQ